MNSQTKDQVYFEKVNTEKSTSSSQNDNNNNDRQLCTLSITGSQRSLELFTNSDMFYRGFGNSQSAETCNQDETSAPTYFTKNSQEIAFIGIPDLQYASHLSLKRRRKEN
ncbi:hypothetical protein TYRP_018745 [Tyrophagus putrescentiae]|nr:hypothetical protein TYRP_018745 [Tyrophagus putrescentiae]